MKVSPTMDFLSDTVLEVMNWAYSHAPASRLGSVDLKKVHEPTSW